MPAEATNPLEQAANAIAAEMPANDGYGLDWTVLIDLVLALLGDCFQSRSTKQVARAITDPGVTERFVMRRVCRAAAKEHGYDYSELYDACYAACRKATPEQAQAVADAAYKAVGAAPR